MRIGFAAKAIIGGRAAGAGGHDATISGADAAALEWCLRLAAAWDGEVVAVCAGAADVEPVLRDALAVGAARAVRIDCPYDTPSGLVAAGLAAVSRAHDVQWWCCGAASADRASGTVPALLAAELRCVSALGLLDLSPNPAAGANPPNAQGANDSYRVEVERRLDRGRRESLRVSGPAVLSFEAGSATLRRAALPALLSSRHHVIEVTAAADPAAVASHRQLPILRRAPYRPRTTVVVPPQAQRARERIAELTGVFEAATSTARQLTATPADAATAILDALHTWGYLDGEAATPSGEAHGELDPPAGQRPT